MCAAGTRACRAGESLQHLIKSRFVGTYGVDDVLTLSMKALVHDIYQYPTDTSSAHRRDKKWPKKERY
jgi:hypothetical protein